MGSFKRGYGYKTVQNDIYKNFCLYVNFQISNINDTFACYQTADS